VKASAASPDAYVKALTGWQRDLVAKLRAAVLSAGPLEEAVKWGHLVYSHGGPVLFIRAEDDVLFGFWRGQDLTIDDRLQPGGRYDMATIRLAGGDRMSVRKAKKLARAAIRLNERDGDPRKRQPRA
jgi:hypothetical protein